MRISDWSSDVCSSDLAVLLLEGLLVLLPQGHLRAHVALVEGGEHGRGVLRLLQAPRDGLAQPGHAHALFELSAGGGRSGRQEERRVGKECVQTGRALRAPEHLQKKLIIKDKGNKE